MFRIATICFQCGIVFGVLDARSSLPLSECAARAIVRLRGLAGHRGIRPASFCWWHQDDLNTWPLYRAFGSVALRQLVPVPASCSCLRRACVQVVLALRQPVPAPARLRLAVQPLGWHQVSTTCSPRAPGAVSSQPHGSCTQYRTDPVRPRPAGMFARAAGNARLRAVCFSAHQPDARVSRCASWAPCACPFRARAVSRSCPRACGALALRQLVPHPAAAPCRS